MFVNTTNIIIVYCLKYVWKPGISTFAEWTSLTCLFCNTLSFRTIYSNPKIPSTRLLPQNKRLIEVEHIIIFHYKYIFLDVILEYPVDLCGRLQWSIFGFSKAGAEYASIKTVIKITVNIALKRACANINYKTY